MFMEITWGQTQGFHVIYSCDFHIAYSNLQMYGIRMKIHMNSLQFPKVNSNQCSIFVCWDILGFKPIITSFEELK